jgi:hypothetical protein
MSDAVGDLVSGTVAGISSKIVEYPFDTIKVRLQGENHPYRGAIDCFRRIASEEGLRGFYSGITAPIAGAAFENAGAFLFYGRSTAYIRGFLDVKPAEPTPLPGVFVAGASAGLATGTVLTPVELLKCRVQVEQQRAAMEKRAPVYRGVLDCAVKTAKADGIRSALFTGYSASMAREIPGSALWFGSYEVVLLYVFTPPGKSKESCPWYAFPLSGVVGGLCYWSAIFPVDTIKTRIQADPAYRGMGIAHAARTMIQRQGVGALYSGFLVTLMRAFPSNACIFGAYELTLKQWKRLRGTGEGSE